MLYYMPVNLITGVNSVSKSSELIASYGSRCLIVTGVSSAKKSGALDDVVKVLENNKIQYGIYDGITQNPLMSECLEAGEAAGKMNADFIIGIGGGSPLDAAKVVAISAANPEADAAVIYGMKWKKRPLPVILVGTTAGTGSEVTKVAVITNADGRKKSLKKDDMYAAVSFGDPRYTMSLPYNFTVSTAIDALAHCCESYFSKKANEISRAAALQGSVLLIPELKKLAGMRETAGLRSADGAASAAPLLSLTEREVIYDASILGGLAISVTGTVFPHNVGYYFTENHALPHGIACALFMPDLVRYAAMTDAAYTEKYLNAVGTDIDEFCDLIESLLPDTGIRMDDELIDSILPRWENNSSVMNTIGNVTTGDIRDILRRKFRS